MLISESMTLSFLSIAVIVVFPLLFMGLLTKLLIVRSEVERSAALTAEDGAWEEFKTQVETHCRMLEMHTEIDEARETRREMVHKINFRDMPADDRIQQAVEAGFILMLPTPLEYLRTDMIVGEDLVSDSGEILLTKGSLVSRDVIRKVEMHRMEAVPILHHPDHQLTQKILAA